MISKKLTSLEVLGVAIRSEVDAQTLYREMAQRATNPVVRERFYLLESEEVQHQTILQKKFNKLYPNVPFKMPPSVLPPKASSAALRRDLDVLDLLDIAIAEEQHSKEMYSRAASQSTDLSGKAMLKFLADTEYSHLMSLTAERDLLRKYPHYYDDEDKPWQNEPGIRKKKI
jgi:rubrerythrin